MQAFLTQFELWSDRFTDSPLAYHVCVALALHAAFALLRAWIGGREAVACPTETPAT